jgi:hypothetical protein
MIKRWMSSVMARGSAGESLGGGPHGERGCWALAGLRQGVGERARRCLVLAAALCAVGARIYEVRSRAAGNADSTGGERFSGELHKLPHVERWQIGQAGAGLALLYEEVLRIGLGKIELPRADASEGPGGDGDRFLERAAGGATARRMRSGGMGHG